MLICSLKFKLCTWEKCNSQISTKKKTITMDAFLGWITAGDIPFVFTGHPISNRCRAVISTLKMVRKLNFQEQ